MTPEPGRRKTRTRQHVIADLGVNFLERIILLAGFTPEEPRYDYGFDLLMLTYTPDGEAENGGVWFQVKATDHLQPHTDGATIPLVVEAADLSLWLFDPFPVMLVLYDATADRAFWLDLQQYAHAPGIDTDEAGETVTLRVSAANLLTVDAARRWRDEKNARLAPRP